MDQASHSDKPVPWLKEDALKALDLFNNERLSYSELASRFGRTVGSIAGLINRFRAKKMVTLPFERPIKKKKRLKKADPIAIALVINSIALRKVHRVRFRLIESDTEVTFAELQSHHCRFPFGDPKRPDFRFCGKPKSKDTPYCREHGDVVYTSPPQRRK